jgi:hypothetical protein
MMNTLPFKKDIASPLSLLAQRGRFFILLSKDYRKP